MTLPDELIDLIAERVAARRGTVALPLDAVAAVVVVPALLSIAAVARLLDCSSRTVRRRIDDGTLPAVIDHGRMMVRADELRGYVDALTRCVPAGRRGAPPTRRASTARIDFLHG